MIGDINVVFQLDNKKYQIELGCNATPKDFYERFLQLTCRDPNLYNFMLEKQNIQNVVSIAQSSSNPLSDYNFEIEPKKSAKKKKFILKFQIEGDTKKIMFSVDSSRKGCVDFVVNTYFKLNPSKKHVKESTDCYELIDELYSSDVNINGKKYTLFYSENATVLDLKYYASFVSGSNCSLFYIGDTQYRNSILFSSIADQPGTKFFKKFESKIYFKLTGDKNTKEAILQGSAIGRNVKRAIAKAIGSNAEGMLEDFLSIDNNGIHIPINTFSKFNISSITPNTPFVYGNPFNIQLNIIMDDEPLDPIHKAFDPEITFEQIRKTISKVYHADSPDFVILSDNSGNPPVDSSKIEDFLSNDDILNCSISPPREVEPCFILYNSKSVKQINVNVDETNSSVLNRIAEKFQIDPKSVCLWANDIQLYDSDRFVKNYLSSTTYNLASKMKVEVAYQKSISTFSLPLNAEFSSLATFCANKYGCPKNSIGFYVLDEKTIITAYEPWNGPIYPGPQYIARYRNSEEKNFVKLVMKLQSENNVISIGVHIKVVIFENDHFVNDECELLSSDQLSKIIEPKTLTKFNKGLNQNSLFYINNRLCRHSMLISEAFSFEDEKVIHIFPQGTLKYTLPGEDKPNYVVVDPLSTINDLIKKIAKSSKKITLSYNGQLINEVFQPVQLFDPQIPFIVENIKEIESNYLLICKKYDKIKNKFEEMTEKMQVDSKTTIANVLASAQEIAKKLSKEDQKKIKSSTIRVTINSVVLTKEMEKSNLIDTFGPSNIVEIKILEKFCFTIQGENLVAFHFSPDDTVRYAKDSMLKRFEAKEKDFHLYFLILNNINIAADDKYLLSDYMDDDELCFDIYPIQFTAKIKAIFPEFTHEYVMHKDAIMFDLKEYFSKFYDLDNPDLIEIIDASTESIVDENDNPINGQTVNVKINGDHKLNEKTIERLNRKTISHQNKQTKKGDNTDKSSYNSSSEPSPGFSCPFIYLYRDESFEFNLDLDCNITCLDAKRNVICYLNAHLSQKDNLISDPEHLLITFNNEKISDPELIFPKYNNISRKYNISFIIEANKIFNMNEFI